MYSHCKKFNYICIYNKNGHKSFFLPKYIFLVWQKYKEL